MQGHGYLQLNHKTLWPDLVICFCPKVSIPLTSHTPAILEFYIMSY